MKGATFQECAACTPSWHCRQKPGEYQHPGKRKQSPCVWLGLSTQLSGDFYWTNVYSADVSLVSVGVELAMTLLREREGLKHAVPVFIPNVAGGRVVIQSETLLETRPTLEALLSCSRSQDLPIFWGEAASKLDPCRIKGWASFSLGAKILSPQSIAPGLPVPAAFTQNSRQTGRMAKAGRLGCI